MNSKHIGNIGEILAIAYLVKKGYYVSIPYGDNARYDLIVDDGIKLHRIQVKTTVPITDSFAEFYLQSSQAHRGKGKEGYTGQIDAFILVDIKNEKLFYTEDTERTFIKLRYLPTESGQVKGINFAEDFLLEKFL